jgi:ABC-type Na+ efflux pump permease subunit
MKADFETIAAALAFIINGAGIAALWELLERKETKETRDDLSEAIKRKISDYGYVKRLRKKLWSELLPVWLVLLHVVNLTIFIGLSIILIRGPERVFSPETAATLAEPLFPLTDVLYWVWLVLFLFAYIIRGFMPTLRLLRVQVKSSRWLRRNEPRRRES